MERLESCLLWGKKNAWKDRRVLDKLICSAVKLLPAFIMGKREILIQELKQTRNGIQSLTNPVLLIIKSISALVYKSLFGILIIFSKAFNCYK